MALTKKILLELGLDDKKAEAVLKKFREEAKKPVKMELDIDVVSLDNAMVALNKFFTQLQKGLGKEKGFEVLSQSLIKVSENIEKVINTSKEMTAINVNPIGLDQTTEQIKEVAEALKKMTEVKPDTDFFVVVKESLERIKSLVDSICIGMNFDNIHPSPYFMTQIDELTEKLGKLETAENSLDGIKKKFEQYQKTYKTTDKDTKKEVTKTVMARPNTDAAKAAREYASSGFLLDYENSNSITGTKQTLAYMKDYIRMGGQLEEVSVTAKKSLADVFSAMRADATLGGNTEIKQMIDDVVTLQQASIDLAEARKNLQVAQARENRDITATFDTKSVESFATAIKSAVSELKNLDIKIPEGTQITGFSEEQLNGLINKLDTISDKLVEIHTLMQNAFDISKLQAEINEGINKTPIKVNVKPELTDPAGFVSEVEKQLAGHKVKLGIDLTEAQKESSEATEKVSLSDLSGTIGEIQQKASAAADAVERITKKTSNGEDASYDDFKRLSEVLDHLKTSLDNINVEKLNSLSDIFTKLSGKNKLDERIESICNSIVILKETLDNPSGASGFIQELNTLASQGESLKDLAAVLKASKKQIEKAKVATGDGGSDGKTAGNSDKKVVQPARSISPENLVYHAGYLGNIKNSAKSLPLGTISPGSGMLDLTGLYTTDNLDDFIGNEWHGKPISTIDISSYKMFQANTNEIAEAAINFFSHLNETIYGYSKAWGKVHDLPEGEKISYDVLSIEDLYKEFQSVFNEVSLDYEQFKSFIEKSSEIVKGYEFEYKDYRVPDRDTGAYKQGLEQMLNAPEEIVTSDSFQTQLMKMLGYQGFDARGSSYGGTYTGGTVIFDVVPETIIKTDEKWTDVINKSGLVDVDERDEEIAKKQTEFAKMSALSYRDLDSLLQDQEKYGELWEEIEGSTKKKSKKRKKSYDPVIIDVLERKLGKEVDDGAFNKFGEIVSGTINVTGDGSGTIKFIRKIGEETKDVTLKLHDTEAALKKLEAGVDLTGKDFYVDQKVRKTKTKNTTDNTDSLPKLKDGDKQAFTSGINALKNATSESSNAISQFNALIQREAQILNNVASQTDEAAQAQRKYAESVKQSSADEIKRLYSDYNTQANRYESNSAGKIEAYNTKVAEMKDNLVRLNAIIGAEDFDIFAPGTLEEIISITTQIRTLNDELKQTKKYTSVSDSKITGLQKQMATWESKNSKALSDANVRKQFDDLYKGLKSGIPESEFNRIQAGFNKIVSSASKAGKTGKTFFEGWKSRMTSLAQYLTTFASFYDVINVLRQGIQVIRDLDTAFVEMQKVSNDSLSSLKEFAQESFALGDSVGTTGQQMQKSAADWMRLGESLNQAKESAKTSNILLNVSEFDNIDSATESLVSMSQAYKDLDKIDIVDKLNNIGNNYSISTDGLATALQKSASALTTAGNDMDEAIALVTAGM